MFFPAPSSVVSNDNVVQEQEQQVGKNLNEADVAMMMQILKLYSLPFSTLKSFDDEQEASIHQSLLNMSE
jgi:hypothetical protein